MLSRVFRKSVLHNVLEVRISPHRFDLTFFSSIQNSFFLNQIHGIDRQQIVWISTHFNSSTVLELQTEHTHPQRWKIAHGNSYLKAESVIFVQNNKRFITSSFFLTLDIFSHSVTESESMHSSIQGTLMRVNTTYFFVNGTTYPLYVVRLILRRQIYGDKEISLQSMTEFHLLPFQRKMNDITMFSSFWCKLFIRFQTPAHLCELRPSHQNV